jgi:hypothetical protein
LNGGLYLWFSEKEYFNRKFKVVETIYEEVFNLLPEMFVKVKFGNDDGMMNNGNHIWSRRYKSYIFIGEAIPFKNTEAELIYNPNHNNRKAWLVVGDILKYYRNHTGYSTLGPPIENMWCTWDGKCSQKFEKGELIWYSESDKAETDVSLGITCKKDGNVVPSCTDDNACTGDQSNGKGGTSTPPTDPPASGKLPDFITEKVTMGNKDGNHEKYTWKINEKAYIHDYIDNIGTADWDSGKAKEIKVSFFLSKGTKKDDDWLRIGDRQNIKRENLKVNKKPKHEKVEFKLQDYANDGTIMPGRTYNFVVCADRTKDRTNNGGDVQEKSETNNCSTEAVFYVDYGPPRNVDLLARNLALTGGRSSLQAGEKYGLQVEISNIGTQQPWNGFSTSYEIKGPGTGGAWQRIGEDTFRASSLYPNATHLESMSSEQEVAAPMVGGDYVFRACADYTQAVPETDESNNCTAELPVYIAPPPMPDLITEGLQLTHGRTSLIAGELKHRRCKAKQRHPH